MPTQPNGAGDQMSWLKALLQTYRDAVSDVSAPARDVPLQAGMGLRRTPPPRDATAPLPASVSHYRIVRRLGGGKSAVVYEVETSLPEAGSPCDGDARASHERMDREAELAKLPESRLVQNYALKILTYNDPEFYERFKREIGIGVKLAHPNVCRVVDWGLEDGNPFLVMELLAGDVMGNILPTRGPIEMEPASQVMLSILAGLQAAHSVGVVHRDLNPSNIFVTEPGGIKLLDFGIARQFGAQSITATGESLGSLGFAAPEQILDTKRVDSRADLFSAGLIFYYMVSGHLPTEAETVSRTIRRLCSGDYIPLSIWRPDAPSAVSRWLDRMLATRPGDRFTTATEAANALRAAWGASATVL